MAEVVQNTLVDGRYRLQQRLGTGGMADVWCAEDQHLGRDVALKILHRRFAQDHDFVERFRREASAAAGLQHPNVVNVYDRGEYDGTYYIAMEFLRGRTLKDLISQEAPLAQERAIDLAIQVLRAAGFAHSRGVIHRDFKPQNVVVDEEDRVKVTDFGIARAGASEITETGSIMGTAQYLSPEQAQGSAVTQASDLYSIGVMLYELLSGQIPFTGDSAVSIALRHLTEPPAPLHQLRPDVHPQLEAVVMHALGKDPRERFQSAEDFIAALEHARGELHEPWTDDTEATQIFAPPPLPPEDYPRRERRSWPWALLALLLVLAGIGAWLAYDESRQVTVANAVGRDSGPARALLEQQGFEVNIEREESLAPVDRVVRQEPGAGSRAAKGSTITIVASAGPPDEVVPSVERLPLKAAVRRLQKAGFKVDVDTEPSDTIKKGLATRSSPDGGTVAQVGDRIRLFVSSGPEKTKVPDVVGLDQDAAEAALEDADLLPVARERESDEPEGRVIEQSPPGGGSIAKGERVTIIVSKGPQSVKVADVVGLVRGDARGQLQEQGFQVLVRERAVTDESDDEIVIDQRPGPGTELRKGRTVVIYVGKFTPPDEPAPELPEEAVPTP